MPVLSVLIPVRDGGDRLLPALESVLAQVPAPGEVVLVDDGSVDGAVDRARGRFPALTVLSPGPVGLVRALALGLEACTGDLVARMDADDLSLPGRFAAQLALFDRAPEVSVCGCAVRSVKDDGPADEGFLLYDAWQNALLTHDDIAREIFVESPLVHPSVVLRREAIRGIGGYQDHGWPEDHDLWLRAYLGGLRFAKVPHLGLEWRDHDARATRTEARYDREAFLRMKAHYLARGPLQGRTEIAVWGAGRVGRRLARHLGEHGITVSRFIDVDPRKIDGERVVGPDALGSLGDAFVVAAVGSRGARVLIREALERAGFAEGERFLCAA